jgi:hypothetical protein
MNENLQSMPIDMMADSYYKHDYQRILVSNTGGQTMSNKWKSALWEKDSTEPAMLRFVYVYMYIDV